MAKDLRSLHFLAYIPPIMHALLPRIFQRNEHTPPKHVHSTAYLDGLRGWAALFVINHHQFAFAGTWFFNLPVIRVVRSGLGMVELFFVISGYVLSRKILILARQKNPGAIFNSLSSTVFRRYMRLFLPTFGALAVVAVLRSFDWYAPMHDKNLGRSLYQQFHDYFVDCALLSNPFGAVGYYNFPQHNFDYANSRYIHILWTISTEFRASIIVYCFLAATCRMTTSSRMTICCLFIAFSYYYTAVYSAMFLSGVFLADLALSRSAETLPAYSADPLPTLENLRRKVSRHMKVVYSIAVFVSLWLLSFPTEAPWQFYWPWPLLRAHLPVQYQHNKEFRKQFFPSFGAPLLIWALDSWGVLQTPFNWSVSQYLGDISFSMYLMHIPVIWTLQHNLLDTWREQWLGNSLWAFLPQMILIRIAVLWAAELFTHVDRKCVAFTKWAENKLFRW